MSAAAPILPMPSNTRPQMAFYLVAVVLVIAAVALNYGVDKLKISFRKLPVEPAEPLKMISNDLGPWAQISVDKALNSDFEHELGASEYVFRDYIDTRLLPEKTRKALLAASMEDREKMRTKFGPIDPKAMCRFALTYYTGSVDTVPHVPDRCYAADGFKPTNYQVVTWPVLPRKSEEAKNVGVRLIQFEDQIDSRQSHPRQVSYFFQVNGYYENDPIFGVRKRLQNLFDRDAYFAKIELVTDVKDTDAAALVMTDFLQHAMPDIERVLPHKLKQTD